MGPIFLYYFLVSDERFVMSAGGSLRGMDGRTVAALSAAGKAAENRSLLLGVPTSTGGEEARPTNPKLHPG